MIPRRRRKDQADPFGRRREDELEDLVKHGSRNFRRYRRRAYAAFAILAAANAFALYEIQSQRIDSIRRSCEGQNRRHDKTIAALDTVIAHLPPGPRRDRAASGRASTVLIIEALAPHQDCETLVRAATSIP